MKKINFTLKTAFTLLAMNLFFNSLLADGWLTTIIDPDVTATSLNIAVNNENVPYIVFLDNTNHDFKAAIWNGSAFDYVTINDDCWSGENSIAINPTNGYPGVIYFSGPTSGDMTYSYFDGTAWNSTSTGISAGAGIGGAYLFYDESGNAYASFHKFGTAWETHFAAFDGSVWTEETIDEVGVSSSATISSDGAIYVAYMTPGASKLKMAKKASGGSWEIEEISDGDASNRPGIKINSNSNPCIGFSADNKAKFAEWDGAAWQINELTNITFGTAGYVCMDMSSNDKAHFTLYSSYTLKYAEYDGNNTTMEDIEIIESTGMSPKIACGSNASIHITYGNKYVTKSTGTNVKTILKASNIICYPNPFTDHIYIQFNNSDIAETKIYNGIGQIVATPQINGNELYWDGKDITGSVVAEGIYFVETNAEHKRRVIKLIKR